MKSKITCGVCLLVALVLSAVFLKAQVVIKGKVTDAETGKPVNNASVYLNGTYAGTSTDSIGKFSLTTIKTNIPLVISCIGYESQSVNGYPGKDVAVALKHKVHQLREVAIGGMGREKEMKIFLREFIGTDYQDCIISNHDDIWFEYDSKKDSLIAGADNPLLIYNKTLGYKITYFLAGFTYTPGETSYAGNYFFAEDTAGRKPADVKKLLLAREIAYLGSRMHFIRALWSNALKNNSFNISGPVGKYVDPDDYESIKKGLRYENIVRIKNDNGSNEQKYIALKSMIFIDYQSEKSQIKPKKGYEGTLIDSNGYYGEGLIWSGDMGTYRVGKLLPFEFQPVGK